MKIHCRWLLSYAAVGLLTLTVQTVKATPYASCVTNNNGTIQFYINESGGNVTVTYEDGSTNANFNGINTGTNLAAGPYSFSLAGHTTYAISIFKEGTGTPGLVPTPFQTPHTYFFSKGTFRGIDVNKNTTSPYFGRIYINANASPGPFFCLNSDGSLITSNSAGISTWALNGLSPYRITVGPDDSLMVGDYSSAGAGVWRIKPDLSSGQLFLGPLGDQTTNSQGQPVHGLIFSRPLVIGNINNGPVTLMDIDNDFPASDPNAILIYTNITAASLPYEQPPGTVGPEIGLSIAGLSNVYPGLTQGGPNDYIYASNYRNNYAVPTVDVFDSTGTNLIWDSLASSGSSDVFVTSDPISNAGLQGPIDTAISPDGQYFVALAIDNHLTVCACTNGIPNAATAQVIDTLYDSVGYENARGVCFDAADNIYFVSSGTALAQSWTLGFTATAVTTGNASGLTGFQVVYPSENVSVTASNSIISQANTYGNPTNTFFVITRTGATSSALTVDYSFSGSALGGTNDGVIYPASFTANPPSSIVFEPGQTSAVVTISAKLDSTPRPTTAVTINLQTSSTYTPVFPTTASISILNTAPQELFVTQGSPTMYNAFSNDYCSIAITRWGDTNLPAYTVNSFSIIGGTAVEGTDFTPPSTVTINPGDLTDQSYIYPLVFGKVPVHTNNLVYKGNTTIIASLVSAAGYTVVGNTNSFTVMDSANPPAPILFADPLTNSAPTNYNVTATDENYPGSAPSYYLNFGYNLLTSAEDPYGPPIAFPPNGKGYALRITANKDSTDDSEGSQTTYSTAVNVYPTNVTFSGSFAVRFNMNVTEPYAFGTGGSYEGPLFGIDCSGTATNWWANNSPFAPATSGAQASWNMDGIWVWLTDSGESEYGDYTIFAGATNSGPMSITPVDTANYPSFENNFKTNIFTSTLPSQKSTGGNVTTTPVPGMPCNGTPDTLGAAAITSWADVEIKQYVSGTNAVITLSIDKTPIMVYTNTTPITGGKIMLGYDSPVFGTDAGDGAAYYSGLQVVQLTPPVISGTVFNKQAATYTFGFTTPDGSVTPSSFQVVGATSISGPYTAVSGATVTQKPNGAFQAIVPFTGATEFYRVQLVL